MIDYICICCNKKCFAAKRLRRQPTDGWSLMISVGLPKLRLFFDVNTDDNDEIYAWRRATVIALVRPFVLSRNQWAYERNNCCRPPYISLAISSSLSSTVPRRRRRRMTGWLKLQEWTTADTQAISQSPTEQPLNCSVAALNYSSSHERCMTVVMLPNRRQSEHE